MCQLTYYNTGMISLANTKHLVLAILFAIATVNFTRTSLEILENSKRLDELSQEVASLSQKKENLKKGIEYQNTVAFVEDKARNDLNMIMPGEQVYVLSQEAGVLGANHEVSSISSLAKVVSPSSNQNITAWLNLFL